jgi:hypothetical protein
MLLLHVASKAANSTNLRRSEMPCSANSYTKYVRNVGKQADKPDRSEKCRQARLK